MIPDFILLDVNMGLGVIEENLDGLLAAMKEVPFSFNALSLAQLIGAMLAIGLGAYESYMMILGKRGIDVMKILRIIIIAICISQSGWIAKALEFPGETLADQAQVRHKMAYEKVATQNKEAAALQDRYVKKLREAIDSTRILRRQEIDAKNSSLLTSEGWSDLTEKVGLQLDAMAKEGAVWVEQLFVEGAQFILRFVAETFFQMIYYGILVTQRIALFIMAGFMPIAFAMSLAPPYSSAWSQFISKYLSITLWAFCIYTTMFFVDHILLYYITLDVRSYEQLLGTTSAGNGTDWSDVGSLGLQGLGSCCKYVVAMFIGAKALMMAPEISGWLIPGGVSSNAGSVAGGAAQAVMAGAGGFVGAKAAGAVGSISKAPGKAMQTAVGGAAAYRHARQAGATRTQAHKHALFSQTKLGHAANNAVRQQKSFGNW